VLRLLLFIVMLLAPDISDSDASHVNRQAALFPHMAGIPTDQEPPAAR
jgi:hypothetical protein